MKCVEEIRSARPFKPCQSKVPDTNGTVEIKSARRLVYDDGGK